MKKQPVRLIAIVICAVLCLQWFASGFYEVMTDGPGEQILGCAIMFCIFWWIMSINIHAYKAGQTTTEGPVVSDRRCPPHRWEYVDGRQQCLWCQGKPQA